MFFQSTQYALSKHFSLFIDPALESQTTCIMRLIIFTTLLCFLLIEASIASISAPGTCDDDWFEVCDVAGKWNI